MAVEPNSLEMVLTRLLVRLAESCYRLANFV